MFQHITVCLDMRGCPNRCRHCWIGHAPNARLPKEALIALAEAFRPFAKRLTVYDWYREPDYGDDYREMWELCGRLSEPLSRSGLNHRLRRILQKAEEIEKELKKES